MLIHGSKELDVISVQPSEGLNYNVATRKKLRTVAERERNNEISSTRPLLYKLISMHIIPCSK